jgi:hypothetical protein
MSLLDIRNDRLAEFLPCQTFEAVYGVRRTHGGCDTLGVSRLWQGGVS